MEAVIERIMKDYTASNFYKIHKILLCIHKNSYVRLKFPSEFIKSYKISALEKAIEATYPDYRVNCGNLNYDNCILMIKR